MLLVELGKLLGLRGLLRPHKGREVSHELEHQLLIAITHDPHACVGTTGKTSNRIHRSIRTKAQLFEELRSQWL